jgi:hypothetical protein
MNPLALMHEKPEKEEDGGSETEDAAMDIMDAIKNSDHKGLAAAMKNMHDIHNKPEKKAEKPEKKSDYEDDQEPEADGK